MLKKNSITNDEHKVIMENVIFKLLLKEVIDKALEYSQNIIIPRIE